MKKYLILVLIVIVIGALTVAVLADKHGQAGKSNIAHLYLYTKDQDSWEIIDGAWGKMKYNLSGSEFDFVFNGHDLEPEKEYSLIYYPDPWPPAGIIVLGSGIANAEGDVHIADSVDTGDLPIVADENYPDGAKIWLVYSEDVGSGGTWAGSWNGANYLFEHNLIIFDAD